MVKQFGAQAKEKRAISWDKESIICTRTTWYLVSSSSYLFIYFIFIVIKNEGDIFVGLNDEEKKKISNKKSS